MAWPLSRLLTFIARSTPRITAAFLNQLQDTLNELFNGVVSVVALVADGVGGQVVAPIAGTVNVAAALAETAIATTVRALGVLAKEHIPGSIAHWDGVTLNIIGGVNAKSITRNAQGDYTVTCSFAPPGPNATRIVLAALPFNPNAGQARIHSTTLEGGTNYLQVRIQFPEAIAIPADISFFLVAWAV